MNGELADWIEKMQPFEIEGDANGLIDTVPRAALRADPQPIRDPRNIGLGEVFDYESASSRSRRELHRRLSVGTEVFLKCDDALQNSIGTARERGAFGPDPDHNFTIEISH